MDNPFDKLKKFFEPEETKTPAVSDIIKQMREEISDPRQMISNVTMDPAGKITGNLINIIPPNVNGVSYNYTTSYGATGTVTNTGSGYYGGINMGGVAMQAPPPTHIVKYNNPTTGKEIVRVTNEGKVVWDNEIDVDEAAEAFSKSIAMGVELKAGITEKVKRDMRDSVFEDIIEIAKQKGSLNAEDLTYLLQAAKIMEKLKGGK